LIKQLIKHPFTRWLAAGSLPFLSPFVAVLAGLAFFAIDACLTWIRIRIVSWSGLITRI
jgi:hypothetical protein